MQPAGRPEAASQGDSSAHRCLQCRNDKQLATARVLAGVLGSEFRNALPRKRNFWKVNMGVASGNSNNSILVKV